MSSRFYIGMIVVSLLCFAGYLGYNYLEVPQLLVDYEFLVVLNGILFLVGVIVYVVTFMRDTMTVGERGISSNLPELISAHLDCHAAEFDTDGSDGRRSD